MKSEALPEPPVKWNQEIEEYRFENTLEQVRSAYGKLLGASLLKNVSIGTSVLQGSLIGAVIGAVVSHTYGGFLLGVLFPHLSSGLGAYLMCRDQGATNMSILVLSILAGVVAPLAASLPALPSDAFTALVTLMTVLTMVKGYFNHSLATCENRPVASLRWIGYGAVGSILLAGLVPKVLAPVLLFTLLTSWVRLPEVFGKQLSMASLKSRLRRDYNRQMKLGHKEPMKSDLMIGFFNDQVLQDLMDWKKGLSEQIRQLRRQGSPSPEKLRELEDLELFSRWYHARVLILRGLEQGHCPDRIAEIRNCSKIRDWENRLESDQEIHSELLELHNTVSQEFEYAETFVQAEREVTEVY